MIHALIGTKLGMTHLYTESGMWTPVTRLVVGPCTVAQVRTEETDGYRAVQLAFGHRRAMNRPTAGHLKRASLTAAPTFLREVRVQGDAPSVGDVLNVSDVFVPGDVVKVSGKTKGRGFTGVVKRWGFSGGPKTHGQSDRHRAPGSIGQGTTPGRVYKGKKMAGRHGSETASIAGLKVVRIDEPRHELWVSGAVPGYRGSLVTVTVVYPAPRPEPQQPEQEAANEA